MIVAFTGTKGSGKDEAIRGILGRFPGGRRFAFAARPKAIARKIWGLTEEQTDGDRKEAPLLGCPVMDSFLLDMRHLTGLAIQPRGLVATTPRELMQFLGTDYVRSIDDTFWVRALIEDVTEFQRTHPHLPALVSDCRFPNEVEAIRAVGGRVVRSGLPKGPYSDHPSEAGIADLQVDAEILNDWTIEDLHRAAVSVLPW